MEEDCYTHVKHMIETEMIFLACILALAMMSYAHAKHKSGRNTEFR